MPIFLFGGAILLAAVLVFIFRRKLMQNRVGSSEPSIPASGQSASPSAQNKFNLKKSIRSWIPLLQSKSKDLVEWERVLIESDMGPKLTEDLLKNFKQSDEAPEVFFRQRLSQMIAPAQTKTEPWKQAKPWVVFIVGVNGVGKTTSLVKLAHYFKQLGLSVGVIGADTFRKAAVEQLERGVQKVGADFFTVLGAEGSEGADPASVVFDGLKKFQANQAKDVILVDTSGRLHTKKNLMEELIKMKRVATKALSGAPHDLWLIVDSTLGQNANQQARAFHEAIGLTGMILTKMDGLSRGGTVFQVFQELQLPIRFLGVGESPSDLKPFDSKLFIQELFDQDTASF